MQKLLKPVSYMSAFAACTMMAFASGCASGGYKLTRQYAGWLNSQNVILRVVLYILTSIVFFVTLLVDVVIFNTVDFWEGKISAGSYNFKEGEKTFYVQHEILPDSQLKRSTINVMDKNAALLQNIVLNETPAGEIEMFVDGKLRTRVHSISEIPVVSVLDKDGKVISENYLFSTPAIETRVSAR